MELLWLENSTWPRRLALGIADWLGRRIWADSPTGIPTNKSNEVSKLAFTDEVIGVGKALFI